MSNQSIFEKNGELKKMTKEQWCHVWLSLFLDPNTKEPHRKQLLEEHQNEMFKYYIRCCQYRNTRSFWTIYDMINPNTDHTQSNDYRENESPYQYIKRVRGKEGVQKLFDSYEKHNPFPEKDSKPIDIKLTQIWHNEEMKLKDKLLYEDNMGDVEFYLNN